MLQGKYDIYSEDLGHSSMKQRQGDTPVFILYGIDSVNGEFAVLASNSNRKDLSWQIQKARIMITRFWDASTFYIVLSCHQPDITSPIPEKPLLDDGTPIKQDQDILIQAGYSDEFNYHPEDKGANTIFYGSIDVIEWVGSPQGGHTLTLQGRDRMKWLMDTTVSYNAIQDASPGRLMVSELMSGEEKDIIPRSEVILEIAQRGIGHIPDQNNVDRGIYRGVISDISKGEDRKLEDPNYHYSTSVPNNVNLSNISRFFYGGSNSKANQPPLLKSESSSNQKNTSLDPEFHIYVTRPGFSMANESIGGVGINVANQTPIDYIKYMAQHEVYPTELFQDHFNGCFYYTPRLNDTTGIEGLVNGNAEEAKERLYRTYFYRPEYCIATDKGDEKMDLRQEIITLKEERSSLSVRTNYIVSNASAGDPKNSVVINFEALPSYYEGRHLPRYYKQIDDELIDTPEEAAAIAASFAQIFSRDTRSGMMVVQGDPTWSPGECLQIRGSPITQDKSGKDYEDDIKGFLETQKILNKNIKKLQNELYDQREENRMSDQQEVKQETPRGNQGQSSGDGDIPDLLEKGTQQANNLAEADSNNDIITGERSGDSDSDFLTKADPESIYRAEAIVHKLNDGREGYYTEIQLVSPF
jgi:hypothetical protein